MKLFTKLTALVVFSVCLEIANFFGNATMDKYNDHNVQDILTASSVLRKSMISDQAHDAIRGYVLLAIHSKFLNDEKALQDAAKDASTQAEIFLKNLKDIVTENPSPEITQTVKKTILTVEKYTKFAVDIIASVKNGSFDTNSYGVFEKSYKELEEIMEKQGNMIQSYANVMKSDYDSGTSISDTISMVVFSILICTISIFAFFIIYRIKKPISKIVDYMNLISGGKYNISIEGTDRLDEIGDMSRALQIFKENAVEVQCMNKQREQEAEKIQSVLERVLKNSDNVLRTTKAMTISSDRVSSQSEEANLITEETNQDVESVAAATKQLSSAILEISSRVAESSRVVQSAVVITERTNTTIQELAESSNHIGEVISLISDIAGRTNLLALNATIEAARAGDAGKGFAVVAAEVKNLANQTSQATEEITGHIQSIQLITQDAVSAISEIIKTIQDIDNASSSIAAAVEEQGIATSEIDKRTQQAASRTREVANGIGIMSAEAQEAKSLSSSVMDSTSQIINEMREMQTHARKVINETHGEDKPNFEISQEARSNIAA
ncbi:Putative methyl-accepting chemotaxis protein [Candidatus Bealeia paramacronuclearis]|uniref:Methyl-accepting chemotaxis protein n=1 Tax=Candidatus Bealeia paramacronuclearis TaxID=1921001 RepID=A0ABZ2C801_9PROT|nr:putative methyl-accepting chemotaxis protein [Candidatus Bealeia paramacronuclearis]